MLDRTLVLKLDSKVVLKKLNNNFWLFDTVNGSQYRLNEFSFSLLYSLDGSINIDTIIKNKLKEYDVLEDKITADILSFFEKMLEKKIVMEV
jgi:hypothetical protein